MNRVYIGFIFLLFFSMLYGAIPQTISYQGKLTDPSGVDYLKRYYNEEDNKSGFFSVGKNIQYYDVTEDGKYKALRGGKRR